MERKFFRTIKEKGEKEVTLRQTVVAEVNGKYLVWYHSELENSKETGLAAYWTDVNRFNGIWTEDK